MRKLAVISLIYLLLLATTASAKWSWFKSSSKEKAETVQTSEPVQSAPAETFAVESAPAGHTVSTVSNVVSAPIAVKNTTTGGTGELVLADFDTGDKPNNLGGDFGAWNKDPDDLTQSCTISFEPDDAMKDPAGYSLKLDYDVDSPNPAYNGIWMKLNGQNASEYNMVSFYVRGEGLNNYTKRLKLEVKDAAMNSSPYVVGGITERWQKIEVPFNRFKKIKDWSALGEFVVVFDDRNSAPKQGTILIDQITFEKK